MFKLLIDATHVFFYFGKVTANFFNQGDDKGDCN